MKKIFSLLILVTMMTVSVANAKTTSKKITTKKTAKKVSQKIETPARKYEKEIPMVQGFDIPEQKMVGAGNPASVFCENNGGKSVSKKDKTGDEYAVCKLNNGTEIDEWDFYRKNNNMTEKGVPEKPKTSTRPMVDEVIIVPTNVKPAEVKKTKKQLKEEKKAEKQKKQAQKNADTLCKVLNQNLQKSGNPIKAMCVVK